MNDAAAAVFGPTLGAAPAIDYCVLVVLVDRRPPRLRFCSPTAVIVDARFKLRMLASTRTLHMNIPPF